MAEEEIAAAFARDGFLIVPELIPREEAAELKAEIRRILAGARAELRAEGRDPAALERTGVLVGLAARSERFARAVRDPRILDVLEAVLGPNIAFFSDKVVFKNAGTRYASPWHQDRAYWGGSHKYSVWITLDDTFPENGCLRVLPGSHRRLREHDQDNNEGRFGNRLPAEEVDEAAAVTAALGAGGGVFFSDLTVHASHPNQEASERFVWIPSYRNALAEEPPYPFATAAAVVRGHGSAL